MKKIISLIICAALLFASASFVFAADAGTVYYVDPVSGSDSAAGTSPETAWASLGRAGQTVFGAGDSLLLKRGCTFAPGFGAKGSGTESAPVTLSAYGEGDAPLISNGGGDFSLVLNNVSNWIVENIAVTAPSGKGIYVLASGGANVENVTVRNCRFFNISPGSNSNSACAVFINNDRSSSRVKNLHLDGLKIENVGWGIQMEGIMAEYSGDGYVSPEASYNRNYLFENLYIERATYGGIVMASVQDATVCNCRVLNSATAGGGAYAPLWTRHVDRVVVEYCEIAGSTNGQDGMAVDFDGWSTNSTYRYIYSHDNTRFMRNCVYDSGTRNNGNSVYNCVSVNDNGGLNHAASTLISFRKPSFSRMSGFTFRDNVIMNGRAVSWLGTTGANVSNVSFSGNSLQVFLQRFLNVISSVGGFTYSVNSDYVNEQIALITANLPTK